MKMCVRMRRRRRGEVRGRVHSHSERPNDTVSALDPRNRDLALSHLCMAEIAYVEGKVDDAVKIAKVAQHFDYFLATDYLNTIAPNHPLVSNNVVAESKKKETLSNGRTNNNTVRDVPSSSNSVVKSIKDGQTKNTDQ
ncbi:uncharacterized protein G2W53_015868 [Senna tora]|uniref:Uncharacterized protein n=1 Tax=Senna tora TaxID=362788 RepID=A0A835C8F4_9FABA|nr:uncharacterized protein G2W53_015868 [Senna tora]